MKRRVIVIGIALAASTGSGLTQVSATATASQQGSTEAIDAARGSSVSRPEDSRQVMRQGSRQPSIRIQGEGIGLPPGVGQGREPQKDKNAMAPICTGADRDGNSDCKEKPADPVADRIDRGLERPIGTARPTDTRLHDGGVALPACTTESREGEACKK